MKNVYLDYPSEFANYDCLVLRLYIIHSFTPLLSISTFLHTSLDFIILCWTFYLCYNPKEVLPLRSLLRFSHLETPFWFFFCSKKLLFKYCFVENFLLCISIFHEFESGISRTVVVRIVIFKQKVSLNIGSWKTSPWDHIALPTAYTQNNL